jgi:hypothetical protein
MIWVWMLMASMAIVGLLPDALQERPGWQYATSARFLVFVFETGEVFIVLSYITFLAGKL